MNRKRWGLFAFVVGLTALLLLLTKLHQWRSVSDKAASLSQVRLNYLGVAGEAVSITFEDERELEWFKAGLRNPRWGLNERWGRILHCELVFGNYTGSAEVYYAPDSQNAYIIVYDRLAPFSDPEHYSFKIDAEAPKRLTAFLEGSVRQ